jgi:hypothetical protein
MTAFLIPDVGGNPNAGKDAYGDMQKHLRGAHSVSEFES